MKIAFIGLGRMGRILAGHILEAGHDLTVWNRTPAAAAQLAARGAAVAPTAADAVRGSELVITALFGPDAVAQVVVDGHLPFAPTAVWVDLTTVSPGDATTYSTWAERTGIRYVHSPVIGSLAPARARELGVLLGGHRDDTEVVLPIVSLWADPHRLSSYDTAAKAATGKLVANLALAVSMQGLVEAMRLGHDGGLDSDEVLTTLRGTGLGWIATMKGENLRSGSFDDTQFSANLLAKDAKLMLHTANRPLPALTAAFESLERAKSVGRGESDFSVIGDGSAGDGVAGPASD